MVFNQACYYSISIFIMGIIIYAITDVLTAVGCYILKDHAQDYVDILNAVHKTDKYKVIECHGFN